MSGTTHSPRKIAIKNVDMPEEVQNDAIALAQQAMERFTVEKDIAQHVKKEFDKKYNPAWHVIVGRSFGSYVTHEAGHFIYFYVNSVAFLIWKAGSA